MPKNNIAIIGTRGAGKTVFVTVLAKYLSTPKNGVLLIPDSLEIAEYVDLNYARLQRGEWLPSTNTEQKLSWKLRVPEKETQHLNLLDFQGEVFQDLFARKGFEGEEIGERDRELVEYLLGASTVLLLINLQDFLDDSFEEDQVRRKGLREHAMKEFLTALKKNKTKHIAVVFTAYHQFRDRIKNEHINVRNFLKTKLPALYYEHIEGSVTVRGFLISAVAETIKNKNGNVPKPGFKHDGLERVIEWIVDPIQYEEKIEIQEQRKRDQEQERQAQLEKKEDGNVNDPKFFNW